MTELRALRQGRFLTQGELAERSGLTVATISRLENGRRRPHLSTVRRLAEALGVRPEKLVGRGDDERR